MTDWPPPPSGVAPSGVLFVDDQYPEPALGAGHPRGAQVLRELAAHAREVLVCPMEPSLAGHVAAMPLATNVSVGPAKDPAALLSALQARPGRFSVLWVGRPHNLDRVCQLRRRYPAVFAGLRIVYDAEAIFALRTIGEQSLRGTPMSDFQQRRLLRAELSKAEIAEAIVAVSASEASVIERHVRRPVTVASYAAALASTPRPHSQRRNLLFVGALRDADSPNADSLRHFIPLAMPELSANGIRLRVAGRGAGPEGWLGALASPAVELLGPVPDLTELYDSALAFVAPTRFGAGIPIKVLDAARHGLPVIGSSLVASQLAWRDGEEMLVAEHAEDWVRAVNQLAHDEGLWRGLRNRALAAIARDHSPQRFAAAITHAAFGTPILG